MSAEPQASAHATPSEDDPRALAALVVHAVYRLIKGCFLHDDANQAIVSLVESVLETTRDFIRRTNAPSVAVLFANNSVFVNRQMLRASRETYQIALDLGALLAPCNVTELTLHPDMESAEVAEFGRAVSAMHRDKKPNTVFAEGGWPHLKVRKVLGFGGGAALPPVTRVARTYAASIMIVRAFYADLRKGKNELSHGLKRVAQKISGALEDEKRLLLSTASAPPADADRSGVAVSSAIIGVLVASQLTDDRTALTNLAMAALLYDAARIRLARSEDAASLRTLNEEEEERLPASGVVALTTLGKLHPPSVVRSVILYEALALRSPTTPPYGGARSPHVLSRILAVARAFAELRVARGSSAPLSIDDSIDVLKSQASDNTTRSLVKLLVGTLGVFPAGTMVELSTGELAVVVATPRLAIDFARPPVRIMYDASATLLGEPIDVDLSLPTKGGPVRVIRKPVDASDQQMKQMRSYVISYAKKQSEASRATTPPPNRTRSPLPIPRVVEPKAPPVRDPEPRARRAAFDPRQDEDSPPPSDVVSPRPSAALEAPRSAGRKSSLPPPRAILPERQVAAPPVDSVPSRRKAQPFGRPPAGASAASDAPPTPPRHVVVQTHRSTRQVDWRVAPEPAPDAAVGSSSETDALLARYVADTPSAHGSDASDVERDSRGSAGLRWDRPSSGKGMIEAPGEPGSANRRPDRSTGGLRWGSDGAPASARNETRPPDSEKRDRPPTPSPPETSGPASGPTSGRAKAGSLGWGVPRRGNK